jgi:hypothetical protein
MRDERITARRKSLRAVMYVLLPAWIQSEKTNRRRAWGSRRSVHPPNPFSLAAGRLEHAGAVA